ncbi:polynucleotide 5'-hydroxyl-kinase Ecym_6217 [Eremothecium cymbalariae DBVPG|uniref:Polynucleotide 5'-hydroxyl-kinase GRC3 n=1 Tax=Eremothecium cymbalariae (strain CBS 270.75 / DBVPG 7215 / KCTC 17166 / NRRL Y-17582) TaxID=931890 RepID=G8JVC0_ERECY|nr:hypothetical protein Ecym_6217 [Eremothecium cymbalariae DBVPG\
MLNTSSTVPVYEDSVSESESEGSLVSVEPSITAQETISSSANEEYDSDESNTGNDGINGCSDKIFVARAGVNFFNLPQNNSIIICLHKYEQLMISGTFQAQIIKGGITYNSVHYNGGPQFLEFWHPISDSIPPIVASFYAAWEERTFNGATTVPLETMNEYECIIRVKNGPNIHDVSKFTHELAKLWTEEYISTQGQTFKILNENDESVRKLLISKQWSKTIDEMMLHHMNCEADTRVLCIGGKKSGKSTLLRLLMQKFLHGCRAASTDENNTLPHDADMVHYLDMDPGQPEYSAPDSISWCKVTSKSLSLGQHLAQGKREMLKEIYIGSSSPQSWPETYITSMESIITAWETENLMGTSVLNLPGWVKGFGIKIINKAVELFKPTHIVFLIHGNKPISKEIIVPDMFTTSQREFYQPFIYNIPLFHYHPTIGQSSQDPRFHAANIRQFRLLAYLHRKQNLLYDPEPLLKSAPLQISFGVDGIKAFQFLQHRSQQFHPDDIANVLQGCVVGIFITQRLPEVKFQGPFPMAKTAVYAPEMEFITLALIHSIDTKNKFINIYVPGHRLEYLQAATGHFVLIRGNTDTPIGELYPYVIFGSANDDVPYINFGKKKKHEHVWKVRKNIKRRGHFIKC